MELIIDNEFKNLIPSLSTEEFKQLEANIISEGCRDALVTWNGIIIDGHNRYEICNNHGIKFRTVIKEFESREDVIDWMINNQIGKRNITPETQSYLRGLQFNRDKKKKGAPEGNENAKKQIAQNEPIVPNISTADRLANQHNVSRETIKRDAKFADAIDKIAEKTNYDISHGILNQDIPISKKEVIEISELEPEKLKEKIDERIIKPHVTHNSGNNEWYTPDEFIEAARRVLGIIELDPASSELANETIKAKTYYTVETDGLEKKWIGKTWMNPPYSGELINKFCSKLVEHYANGDIPEAIILVNNATETAWFNILTNKASAILFPKSRIKYKNPTGESNSPLQGQAFVYFGDNQDKFIEEFKVFGWGAYICQQ